MLYIAYMYMYAVYSIRLNALNAYKSNLHIIEILQKKTHSKCTQNEI